MLSITDKRTLEGNGDEISHTYGSEYKFEGFIIFLFTTSVCVLSDYLDWLLSV